MTQTIIVGVDQSEPARAAARTAARLSQALGAELLVVTAYGKYEFEVIDPTADDVYVTTHDLALAVADEIVADLRTAHPGLDVSSVAVGGKPGEALVTVAERHDAGVIVIGNRRVQGLARVFGSIARDVAAHASCDVYVVNTQSHR